jgi:hypothetical protein
VLEKLMDVEAKATLPAHDALAELVVNMNDGHVAID